MENSNKNIQRKIITEDGSISVFSELFSETYHSSEGAVQESEYLFIDNGLAQRIDKKEITILEYGFGTGLNAALSYRFIRNTRATVKYYSIEKYPIAKNLYEELSYSKFGIEDKTLQELHSAKWGEDATISDSSFILHKIEGDFLDFHLYKNIKADVVYWDAFSSGSQPELWTDKMFAHISSILNEDGIFVTYSAIGTMKKALRNAGLTVHRIKGAGNKRHSVVAVKTTP